jgi:Domain of unknown function (DUF4926)
MKPELFDVVELLVNLPEYNLKLGEQGTIVEEYNDGYYEVEFSDPDGQTIALCPLSIKQFILIWQAKTKTWLSLPEKLTALITNLPNEQQQEI